MNWDSERYQRLFAVIRDWKSSKEYSISKDLGKDRRQSVESLSPTVSDYVHEFSSSTGESDL